VDYDDDDGQQYFIPSHFLYLYVAALPPQIVLELEETGPPAPPLGVVDLQETMYSSCIRICHFTEALWTSHIII
jgi:hypothetical protein